jgi:hypothetical protein
MLHFFGFYNLAKFLKNRMAENKKISLALQNKNLTTG